MYATLHEVTGLPGPQDGTWIDDALSAVRAPAAPTGVLVSRGITMGDGRLVALWATEEDARAAATATPPSPGPGPDTGTDTGTGTGTALSSGQCFTVSRRRAGAAGGPARYLQLTCFDGPRDETWVQAVERADDERIWPAVRDVPGNVEALTLTADDGGRVVLVLAETVESLEDGMQRILSTTLLPGEDPSQLTGPDRVDVQRLVHVELPQAVRA